MTAKRRPNDCDQVVTVRECGGVGNLSHETMRSLVRNRRGEEVEKSSYFATTFQPPADPMSVIVFQLFSIKYNADQRWKGVMSGIPIRHCRAEEQTQTQLGSFQSDGATKNGA